MGPHDTPIIDCQCHLFTRGTLDRLRSRAEDPRLIREGGADSVRMGAWTRRIGPAHTSIGPLLAAMDSCGVTRAALSPNDPGPEWFEPDVAAVARESNDQIAVAVAAAPDRLFGVGVLPLPDVDGTVREMGRGVRELGLKGFLLYTNCRGRHPDTLGLDPVFSRAVALGVPLLLHPAKPAWDTALADIEMIAAVGNMFEDTVALLRLILTGVLDRHPALKLVCPHLGGALPFLIGRVEHQMAVLKRGPRGLRQSPLAYLRQVYFDVVSPQPSSLRLLLDLVGPDRLLFASDHPWVQPALILETLDSMELGPSDREAILFRNATRLFNLNG